MYRSMGRADGIKGDEQMPHIRDDLRSWAELCEAARALDASVDLLPTEEADAARRLLMQVDKQRAEVELRVLAPLGVEPLRPFIG